jgi:hypothetical protein
LQPKVAENNVCNDHIQNFKNGKNGKELGQEPRHLYMTDTILVSIQNAN